MTVIKRSSTWQCGYCNTGNHASCRGAVRNQGAMLLCKCGCADHQCIDCGNREPDGLAAWTCINPEDCRDTLAARSAANPLTKELEIVRLMGGEARRRALMERTRRLVMSAVEESGIDRMLGEDEPEPRRVRSVPQSGGKCLCCGAPTKGGRFQPGHDARLKGRLRREAKGGSFDAVRQLREFGWPVPEGAPSAPALALAG